MERNIILAGVGGQGILTIAHVISAGAVRRGWHVKQAEVHGMSQRGGAVYSHLRLADHPIHSDLIPDGECDLIVAMEPLEGLRYVSQLRAEGAIISGLTPFINIPNYPALDELLGRIAARPEHVLVDADRLARSAGAGLGANCTLLGATAHFLELQPDELEELLCHHLAAKGPRIVEANRKAFRLGYLAADGYREGLARGVMIRDLRTWAHSVSMEELAKHDGQAWFAASGKSTDADTAATIPTFSGGLPIYAAQAVSELLDDIHRKGRTQLREHEVYQIIEHVGAITPPHYVFIPAGTDVAAEALESFPGDTVVVKIVSADVVHKSDSGGVLFIRKSADVLKYEIRKLYEKQVEKGSTIDGVLLVEFIEHDDSGFGKELFVGIRASRSFGPVIVAGVGGIDTEYLAERMRPGAAAARALATDTTAEEFLELFKTTAAYDVVAGKARGHRRVVSDGELLRCFRAFLALAREFCVERGDGRPTLAELEVNPFAFVRQKMVPLDGRGRLGPMPTPAPPRPLENIRAMLEPESIALIGASAQRRNFARIILSNIIDAGFPIENVHVVHPEAHEIDGVRCIRSIKFTAEPIDLLVAAVAAENAPRVIEEAIESGRVKSIILIPGGLGETEGSESLQHRIQTAVHASRQRLTDEPKGTARSSSVSPVVLGGNCLGVRSRPGRYDTFFIPSEKMDPRRRQPASPTALITQSGALAITRLGNLDSINPAIAVTVGNQTDITVSDMVRVVGSRDDIVAIGVYVEGFNVLDGLEFVQAVEEVTRTGKVVVFYKAGRTPQGRTATAGHTASIAGDFDVCQAAVASAGAIVVDTFKEFEQLIELATLFSTKIIGGGQGPIDPGLAAGRCPDSPGFAGPNRQLDRAKIVSPLPLAGRRIAAITNAGAEAVGIADTIRGPRYQVEMAEFSEATVSRIQQALAKCKLDKLVNVCNPLDVNPMADEDVYECTIRAMMDDPGVDAVVVSLVPFTPHLLTTPTEINDPRSLAHRIPAIFQTSTKPMLVVIDAGRPYDVLAGALRQARVPVFPTCDQAIRSLGRYLHHFSQRNSPRKPRFAAGRCPV